MVIWTGGTGAGFSAGAENSAIPDTLESVADPAQLFEGVINVNG